MEVSKEEYLRKFLLNESKPTNTKKTKKARKEKQQIQLIDDDENQIRRNGSDDEVDMLDDENMPVFVETAESSKFSAQQRIQALSHLQGSSDQIEQRNDKLNVRDKSPQKKMKKSKLKRRHDSDSEADDDIMKIEKEQSNVKRFKKQMNQALGMQDNNENSDKEEESTKKESSEIASKTVHRDEFGQKIDIDSLIQEKLSKKEQIEELKRKNQERIDMWGKGLKQKDDRIKKKQEMEQKETYEGEYTISKQADIALMKQERFNDPMRYLIQKEDQKIADAKISIQNKSLCRLKSKFAGITNRFDIPPGHMWDGVDRGNGAEKRYFNMVNSKKDKAVKAHEMATLDL